MELGQIVQSKCGRDKDKNFLIVKIDDNEEYIYLADGLIRKIERPKKKKVKHVIPLYIDKSLNSKLTEGMRINNSEIRKCLSNMKQQNENNSYINCITEEDGG